MIRLSVSYSPCPFKCYPMINIDSIICIKLESKKAHRQSTFQSALAKKRCGKIKKKVHSFSCKSIIKYWWYEQKTIAHFEATLSPQK